MKKLMFAVAALAAGVACAEITSANVVGYQNIDLSNEGRNFVGATFAPVSGTMTLEKIGVNGTFTELADTLYTINGFGGVISNYAYLSPATATEVGLASGWYIYSEITNWDGESTLTVHNDDPLSVGQMVCVSVTDPTAKIVSSGQVDNEDIALAIDNTVRNFLINCTPVDITLGQILPNEKITELADTLYTINPYGGVKANYTYLTPATAAEVGLEAGWYIYSEITNWDGESTLTCQNDVVIPAGQGFVVSVTNPGTELVIPSAL